ncbi:MAG: alpha-amylase family glycosyl hydrolase, partial [Clostridiaceae bacterium]
MKKSLVKRILLIFLTLCLLVPLAGCFGAEQANGHALNVPDDNYRTYYEIFVASFYDSDGDGIGDLNGITQKLDYLNDGDDKTDTDLGFNGIWLMPIMPSPTYHKYDVTDYTAIDPAYGTLEDFQALLDACHARGIRLIIDFVFNHTSAKHPWFLQAVEYYKTLAIGQQPDFDVCPYAAYYHFSTEKKSSSGWYRVGNTDWYYEGKFWDQMPDLALENEQVRKELENAAAFWLNMGVDGFRLDAVKEFVSGSPESNIEILSWFSDYVISVNPNAYLVGEAWETNAVSLSAYYKSGITSLFDFPVSQATGSVSAVIKGATGEKLASLLTRSAEVYGAVNSDYIDAPFLSNHDTSRVSAQYVNDIRKMK